MTVLFSASAVGVQNSQRNDSYQIVHVYPHDSNAFTQGLIYVDGHLYESTGQNGKSSIKLEYVHGEIYANVWHTDQIARISPRTGKILGWIDLSGLLNKKELTDPEAVLNGIAYDPVQIGSS
jgi:glutamine cyclotransferase